MTMKVTVCLFFLLSVGLCRRVVRDVSSSESSDSEVSEVSDECPCLQNIPPMDNFDEDKFLGIWYQVRWYYDPVVQNANWVWTDATMDFNTKAGQDDKLFVLMKFKDSGTGQCGQKERFMTRESPAGIYRFLHPTSAPFNNTRRVIPWTDYDNQAIMISCGQPTGGTCTALNVHFLQRDPVLDSEFIDFAENYLDDICYPHPNTYGNNPQPGDCTP